jgi:hypothetical protein
MDSTIFIIILVVVVFYLIAIALAQPSKDKHGAVAPSYKKSTFVTPPSYPVTVYNSVYLGKYISGHPRIDKALEHVRIIDNDHTLFLWTNSSGDNTNDYKYEDKIEKSFIKNITIEDQTSIERRVSLGRFLLVGPLAFAMRKKTTYPLTFIFIEWNDGRFDHQTVFEFSMKNSVQFANEARNGLIRKVS